MLHADDDRVDARGLVVLELHRHQRLAVGGQVGQQALGAHLVEPAGQAVGEHDGQRHALGRVEARVPEQRRLLRSLADGPVRASMRHARDDAARVGVEPALRGVADLGDDVAGDPRHVDARGGDGVDGQEHQARRHRALRRDLRARVLAEEGVDDPVRDLVADLVRVTPRDRLRREDGSSDHGLPLLLDWLER